MVFRHTLSSSLLYKYKKQLKMARVSRDGTKSTQTRVSRDNNKQDLPYNLFSSKGSVIIPTDSCLCAFRPAIPTYSCNFLLLFIPV